MNFDHKGMREIIDNNKSAIELDDIFLGFKFIDKAGGYI